MIEGKWKNKAYYHEDKQISDYNNREDCTQHKLSGLWDLNTQDDTVTEGMHDLLVQTVVDGADGFRYDAAKHIELSDEVFGGKQSHYWDTILQNGAQYQYGEVLEDAMCVKRLCRSVQQELRWRWRHHRLQLRP